MTQQSEAGTSSEIKCVHRDDFFCTCCERMQAALIQLEIFRRNHEESLFGIQLQELDTIAAILTGKKKSTKKKTSRAKST